MKKTLILITIFTMIILVTTSINAFAVTSNDIITAEETLPADPTVPETVPTQPETIPETIPETDPPTYAPTQPETLAPTYAPTDAPTYTPPTQPETYVFDNDDNQYDNNNQGNIDDDNSPTTPSSYETNTDISTDNAEDSDWQIDIDDITTGGGDDFSSIKDNKSTDDSDNSWMLILAISLIAVSVLGIGSVIYICMQKNKKLKALRAQNIGVTPRKKSTSSRNEQMLVGEQFEENIDINNYSKQGNRQNPQRRPQNKKNVYVPKDRSNSPDRDKYNDNF